MTRESRSHSVVSDSVQPFVILMDRSPPGSSIHGILQARITEWVAIPFIQGISPTQESNPGLPYCRQVFSELSHQGSPRRSENYKTPRRKHCLRNQF